MRGIKMLRPEAVGTRFGKVVRSIWEDIRLGLLPPPVRVGPRACAIPEHEVDEVLKARIAGKTDAEIRKLVKRLVAERAKLIERAA